MVLPWDLAQGLWLTGLRKETLYELAETEASLGQPAEFSMSLSELN